MADCDWQVEAAAIVKGTTPGCQLTASRTVTRFNILGNGQGGSFEADGNDGSPLFVKPPGITMGPDDIPNSGISLNGRIYFLCNTGSDTSLANPQAGDYSVLVQFDEATQTFTGARTISPAWPNDSPTAGNLSVVYSSALNLWLMTYDGGRQSNKTRGIYFSLGGAAVGSMGSAPAHLQRCAR